MKKIIVPTDFSKAAEAAAHYGAWLAQKMSASMELVHVIGITISKDSLANWRGMEREMAASAKKQAEELISGIRNPVEITYKQLNGGFVEKSISDYALKTNADLVVIGSLGASGLKKTIFGSNALKLIDCCPVPVVVVPSATEFDGIREIIYATDMIHLDEEIKTIARFAKNFDSRVVIVHVTEGDAGKRDHSNLKAILRRISEYENIDLKFVAGHDVATVIQEEASTIKPGMIAMFTHQRDFIDKVMGTGVTRQVAIRNKVPLMVINRSTSR